MDSDFLGCTVVALLIIIFFLFVFGSSSSSCACGQEHLHTAGVPAINPFH